MKKLEIIAIIYLCLLFSSCSHDLVQFEVTNISNNVLDSVVIRSLEGKNMVRSRINTLKENATSNLTLDLSNVEKIDGSYFIEVYSKKVNLKKSFGYYSNGAPTGFNYKIEIFQDSIQIKELFNQ